MTWRSVLFPQRGVGTVPLALGVELRQREAASAAHWSSRRMHAVSARDLERDPRDVSVGLRPLVRSDATGAWIQGDVHWDALRRGGGRFVAAHLQWFTELFGIARDVRVLGGYRDDSDWVTLDTVDSALLWPHLARAGAIGIPLVPTKKHLDVALAPAAAVEVEVSRTGDGDLRLSPRVEIGGSRVAAASVRPVAHTGVYAFETRGRRIALTLAPAALTDTARTLLGRAEPLLVPATDADEFLHDAYPRLARGGGFVAAPGITLPALEAQGAADRHRELTGDPRITVTTVESPDPDWFELGILVEIDGRTIPFAPLFAALSQRKKKLLLADGRYFSLSHPALDRLRELIEEAGTLSEWEAGPRISRHQLALWADFEDLADEAVPAVAWRELVRGLRDADGVPPTVVPGAVQAELRPYQRDGLSWLAFLWRHRLGRILADDMGLGKTLQLLALVAHARAAGERRPVLVVAPTSVLGTWAAEAARFVPGLRVRVVDATAGKRGQSVAATAAGADLVITSYTLLRLDDTEFAGIHWAFAILDEAQFVKNPATRLHRAVRDLTADAVYAATGTPLENSLNDLWALLSLTAPGLFPSSRRFREQYVKPIERGKVPENEEGGAYRAARLTRLRHRIRPLMLRRTKEAVAPELPERAEQELRVALGPAHRALYDTVLQRERQKVLGLLDDLDRNRFIVFRSLTLLRMLSLAPVLVDPEHAHLGSSKLDALVERIVEAAAEGHRVLVFSQFTSFLRLAGERLDAAGIAYGYLDGSTRRRADVIERWRTGAEPAFLISLKAGGFGLTLTEADYVFVLDPWWNPAAEAQAVDRTHRIGQTRSVLVYRLIAEGTIEEKVLALQRRKARLFQAVVDDDELFSRALTADDIRGLLY
ncbi:DEAD/DEAH box helicase [Microbacterium sp.]|uniref:DEAD/DEAH box helicase n=1 Tax=Microbacterium sp. TaxID=51671 RepID=UPI0039E41151